MKHMLAVLIKINDSIQVILLSEKCRLKKCYLKKDYKMKAKLSLPLMKLNKGKTIAYKKCPLNFH